MFCTCLRPMNGYSATLFLPVGYTSGGFKLTDFTTMKYISRKILLATLTKHETLTIDDIAKEENLGLVPDKNQLKFLLRQLTISGHILVLDGITPVTYTITTAGIDENIRFEKA